MDPLEPIIQYGFAGMCAVLLSILVWLAKAFLNAVREHSDKLVEVTKTATDVVRDNSEAIREVKSVEDRQIAVIQKVHEELLKRPCLQLKE
jgi:hypothetical protein